MMEEKYNKLFWKIYSCLFFSNSNIEVARPASRKVHENNRDVLLGFTAVACIIDIATLIRNYVIHDNPAERILFIGSLIVLATLFFLGLIIGKKSRIVLNILSLITIMCGSAYGILMSVVFSPGERAVTYMVFLILMPMIFCICPITAALVATISVLVFLYFEGKVKTGTLLADDTSNAIFFGIVSFVCSVYFSSLRIKGEINRNRVKELSERDMLTSLKNRNSYELALEGYTKRCKKCVSCIYLDVNGLHELNNEKGHAEGDSLIRACANEIIDRFGSQDTYRVGGDEFIVFVVDGDEEEIRSRMIEVQENARSETYNVAAGLATQEKDILDMTKLVSNAEQLMFANKNEYYRGRRRIRR